MRNVSPSLGLCDHFPGCGILNYGPGRAWSLMVCIFQGVPRDTSNNRSLTLSMVSPKISLLP